MLVSTMSDEEKRGQAISDSKELFRYITFTLHKTIVKEVKRFNKFPRVLRSSYVTKNGNKYHLMFKARSRNEFNHCIWGNFYTIMESDEGKYVMTATLNPRYQSESFQIYTPHLFARYSERCGLNLHGEERIHRFMEGTLETEYQELTEYEPGRVMAPVDTGLILGDKEGDIIVFKTFVDYERLYDDQIEIGEQVIDSSLRTSAFYKKEFKRRHKYARRISRT